MTSSAASLSKEVQWLTANRLSPCLDLLVSRDWLDWSQLSLLAPVVEREQDALKLRTSMEQAALSELGGLGVPLLLLKGAALARWLYPAPDLRDRLDMDLLVDVLELDRLREHLHQTGWRRWPMSASVTQETWRRQGLDLDLHWRLSDHPVFFHVLDFSELWSTARGIRGLSEPVRTLAPVYALVHAVIHYFGSHSKEPMPALFLVDLLLLWESLDSGERRALDGLLGRLGLHGLAARAFQLADQCFPGADCDAPVEEWRQRGSGQWQTALAEPHGRVRGLHLALRAQPGLKYKLTYLAGLAFPRADYMVQKYPGRFPLGLPGRYLYRMIGGLVPKEKRR